MSELIKVCFTDCGKEAPECECRATMITKLRLMDSDLSVGSYKEHVDAVLQPIRDSFKCF